MSSKAAHSHPAKLPPGGVRPTRFPELGYRFDGPRCWRIYDITDKREAAVGPFYASKAELFADLDRYAKDYGVNG